jgi:phage FluMu gp28-like protein
MELSRSRGQLFAGIDFARKNHLTVCWIFERVPWRPDLFLGLNGHLDRTQGEGDSHFPTFGEGAEGDRRGRRDPYVLITREVLVMRNISTPEQIAILRPRLQRVVRACVDYTGAGIGLGDFLVKQFGEFRPESHRHGKIELCQFTNGFKNELFPRLRAAFEHRSVLIPCSPAIREDLHAMQKVVSPSGGLAYRALGNSDGHSDRCTALALALRAAESQAVSQGVTIVRWKHRWAGDHTNVIRSLLRRECM